MRIDKPGRVTDRIYFLGREESCVYLLQGEGEYALIGGGMAYAIPEVIGQLEKLGIEEDRITRLVVLHAHFDHVGIIPFFHGRLPRARITASVRTGELFANPRVAATIADWNRQLASLNGRPDILADLGIDYSNMPVHETVGEGDEITLSGLTLRVLDTPGHSSCSISVYVPEEKALFGSDAAGVPFKDQAITVASSNFFQYEQSLRKMADLSPEVYLAGHYGAMTGRDAADYLRKSIISMEQTREALEESYARTGDVEATARELTDRRMNVSPGYFVPDELQYQVTRQMINNYLKNKPA